MHLSRMLWSTALVAVNLTLAACGGELADPARSEPVSGEPTIGSLSEALNSPIYDRARAYATAHPKRDGGTWDQWCASLVWRFGNLPEASVRPSAIAAYHDSKIVSTNASIAKIGAFHFWSIGTYGHVGVDLNGAGKKVFMATRNLSESWGDAIGINSVSGYSSKTGAHYLGWSMDYAGGKIAGGGGAPVSVTDDPLPPTTTEADGIPGTIFYERVQTVGQRDFGYTGPIDGVTGSNTELVRVKITARELNSRGTPRTSAEEDGVPGSIYWTRVQTVGRDFGYTGPIDGVPDQNTYNAENRITAYAVNRAF